MSVAEDILKDVISVKLQSNVMDIKSYMNSLRFMSDDIVTDLQSKIQTFNPTSGITDIISGFKNDTESYVLKFADTYKDGSNAVDGLTNIFNEYVCLGGWTEFLDIFNNYANIVDNKIQQILSIPEDFIYWFNNVFINSLMQRIRDMMPYIEFNIGIDLSVLFNNSIVNGINNITRKIGDVLKNLDYLVNCLQNIGIDLSGEVNEIYGIMDEMYLQPDGNINFNKLASNIPTQDILNIKDISKSVNVIINNNFNEIAKVTGRFTIPNLANAININPINPINNPLSKYYVG